MKTPLIASLLVSALSLPAFAQKAGDAVTPDALGKLEWVKGTAPATWEPGKLYVLECWATWCGPCIAAIPHVDALYDKYQEKGLRVIGVNVWEDGKDKVEAFVKTKGDGMSYPVAYTGKGGAFETEWLKPAEVRGIPHAFVVKDGKVLLTTHPMQLSEEVIEGLLAGGEGETKALDGIKAAQQKQTESIKSLQAFRQAYAEKDAAGMAGALEDLRKIDPESRYLAGLSLEMALTTSDWAAAEAALEKGKDDPMLGMSLYGSAVPLAENAESPASLRKIAADTLAKQLEKGGHPSQFIPLAKLQWSLGEKDAAKATAKRAIEATAATAGRKAVPSMPYERFAAALEKGEMPAQPEITGWIRETIPADAKPAAKVTPKEN